MPASTAIHPRLISRCSAGYSDPCSTCNTSSELNSIALAMAWPCVGPSSSVRRISRSRVPCSSSMRSRCSLVDILGEATALPVECQGEQEVSAMRPTPDKSHYRTFEVALHLAGKRVHRAESISIPAHCMERLWYVEPMETNCLFCESPAGSKEHLWAAWIHERKDFGPLKVTIGGSPEEIRNDPEQKIETVCHKCNNEWMSRVENKTKPIIACMFEDLTIPLDRQQQTLLSNWAVKTAMVLDSVKNPE